MIFGFGPLLNTSAKPVGSIAILSNFLFNISEFFAPFCLSKKERKKDTENQSPA